MSIKGIALRGRDWWLLRRGKMLTKAHSTYGPSINVMLLALELLTRIEVELSVIQIGANDGLRDDPIQGTIRSRNLPALLVEPLPDLVSQLKRHYSASPGIVIENAAIGEKYGQKTLYRIAPAAEGLPDWVHGLASFDKSLLLKHPKDGGLDRERYVNSIVEAPVEVLTFSQLLDRHPSFRLAKILQVDTEGYDRIVVESAIQAGLEPKLINYEHKHLSILDQEACRRLLAGRGYSFSSSLTDTVAIKF